MSVPCAASSACDFDATGGKLLVSGLHGNYKECCGVRLRAQRILSTLRDITSHVSSGREPVIGGVAGVGDVSPVSVARRPIAPNGCWLLTHTRMHNVDT